jgi:hypothetical protein
MAYKHGLLMICNCINVMSNNYNNNSSINNNNSDFYVKFKVHVLLTPGAVTYKETQHNRPYSTLADDTTNVHIIDISSGM